jgi:hypothetical protein
LPDVVVCVDETGADDLVCTVNDFGIWGGDVFGDLRDLDS